MYGRARKLVGILLGPLVVSALLILRIFQSVFVLRITLFEPRFFGHQALEPEVFLLEAENPGTRSPRIIWLCCPGPRRLASNRHLWNQRRKALPCVPSLLVTELKIWQHRLRIAPIAFRDASYHRLNLLTTRQSSLPPRQDLLLRRQEVLERLHEASRPYVIVTVRDVNSDPDPRNRRVSDLYPTMRALVDRGYNVIRLASRTEDRVTLSSPHILDWHVVDQGKPGDELALVEGCQFVVSSTTGVDCLALAYRRPVLYFDTARFFYVFLGTELATFTLPQFRDSESGEYLSLRALSNRGLCWVKDPHLFKSSGVGVFNSDPEEIAVFAAEYADTLLRSNHPQHDHRQERWREILLARHRAEITSKHGQIRAVMSNAFLNRYSDALLR